MRLKRINIFNHYFGAAPKKKEIMHVPQYLPLVRLSKRPLTADNVLLVLNIDEFERKPSKIIGSQ